MNRVQPGQLLHDIAATRQIEAAALAVAAPHTLMQRAGVAVARLAMAMWPHARQVWIACGPGNNGGDGLVAAAWLQSRGWSPVVTLVGHGAKPLSADAAQALVDARAAGVAFADGPPRHCDLVIDALLGIGARGAPGGPIHDAITTIRQLKGGGGATSEARAAVLAIDVPSGLNADTGQTLDPSFAAVVADATLTLLTVKPGLFTARGRDHCGAVWYADLGATAECAGVLPQARLGAPSDPTPRPHTAHKGSQGDVWIIGGDRGMTGAALLAGQAALHAGAGRVYLHLLAEPAAWHAAPAAELMTRELDPPSDRRMPERAVAVCGCGGGTAVSSWVSKVLEQFAGVVLDADAITSIATQEPLRLALRGHASAHGHRLVLTPHPLEAARLLGTTVASVQDNRLRAAQALADATAGTVVLKGSGSVIASPGGQGRSLVINTTGNARLATAGTGDVLAGLLGARLAQGLDAHTAACQAVWEHGAVADTWDDRVQGTLTASHLAAALRS